MNNIKRTIDLDTIILIISVLVGVITVSFIVGYFVTYSQKEDELTKREAMKIVSENPDIPIERLMLILNRSYR